MNELFPDDRVIYKNRPHGIEQRSADGETLYIYEVSSYLLCKEENMNDDWKKVFPVNTSEVEDGSWVKRKDLT